MATVGSPIAFPVADAGSVHAFALSGSATSDGELSLSVNGKYVVVGGYNRAAGVTCNVVNASAATVNRMIARIDAANGVDTSTLLGGSAFSGNNIRGVATLDGTQFWAGGAGGANAGVWYITHGQTTPAPVQVYSLSAVRWLGIFNDKLYGTSSNSPNQNVFTVSTASSDLPTTAGAALVSLADMAPAQYSPFGFAVVDRNGNGAVDTVYMADDGMGTMPVNDQGIQKWTLSGGTWGRDTSFTVTPAIGYRGLAALVTATDVVTLVATTAETANNRIYVFVDSGSGSPTSTLMGTSSNNTLYRGVAFSPHL